MPIQGPSEAHAAPTPFFAEFIHGLRQAMEVVVFLLPPEWIDGRHQDKFAVRIIFNTLPKLGLEFGFIVAVEFQIFSPTPRDLAILLQVSSWPFGRFRCQIACNQRVRNNAALSLRKGELERICFSARNKIP